VARAGGFPDIYGRSGLFSDIFISHSDGIVGYVPKHGRLKEVGIIQDPIHHCASNQIVPPGTIS